MPVRSVGESHLACDSHNRHPQVQMHFCQHWRLFGELLQVITGEHSLRRLHHHGSHWRLLSEICRSCTNNRSLQNFSSILKHGVRFRASYLTLKTLQGHQTLSQARFKRPCDFYSTFPAPPQSTVSIVGCSQYLINSDSLSVTCRASLFVQCECQWGKEGEGNEVYLSQCLPGAVALPGEI